VQKTTLYPPEDLKAAVKRAASERRVSEAEITRESIRTSIGGVRQRPRGALYASGKPIARQAEEMLAGFGERRGMPTVIVDTSALLAFFDVSEPDHESVAGVIGSADVLVVSPYVVASWTISSAPDMAWTRS
jgi:hypothetical protein